MVELRDDAGHFIEKIGPKAAPPAPQDLVEASRNEIKSKSDLPFYHKDNVNIDLCRTMWIWGVQWERERAKSSQPAPQDLRDRAEELVKRILDNERYLINHAKSVDLAIQFASEVSGEKDKKRIAELELSLKQALMMAEAGNKGITQARKRIEELEEKNYDLQEYIIHIQQMR